MCFMMRLVASFGRLQDERRDGHRLFLISTAVFDLNDVVSLILIVLLVDLKAATECALCWCKHTHRSLWLYRRVGRRVLTCIDDAVRRGAL